MEDPIEQATSFIEYNEMLLSILHLEQRGLTERIAAVSNNLAEARKQRQMLIGQIGVEGFRDGAE